MFYTVSTQAATTTRAATTTLAATATPEVVTTTVPSTNCTILVRKCGVEYIPGLHLNFLTIPGFTSTHKVPQPRCRGYCESQADFSSSAPFYIKSAQCCLPKLVFGFQEIPVEYQLNFFPWIKIIVKVKIIHECECR